MPEIKKVEIEAESTPPPQPTLAETQLQMATVYGQMVETNRQLITEVQADKSERSSLAAMMTEALAEIRNLRSQTDTTSHRVEQLNESQTAITSAVMADSEKDESQNNLMEVTPMETHIEIDQKPAKKTNGIWAMLFK